MKKGTIAAIALAAAGAVNAQAVYRCGNEYSDKPCADARAVDAKPPAPTAAEAQQAQAQARRNARLADTLEKDRLAQEKKVAGPSMVVVGQRPAASEAAKAAASAARAARKSAKKGGRKQPEHFTATVPAKPSK